jgi:hypothetical protein
MMDYNGSLFDKVMSVIGEREECNRFKVACLRSKYPLKENRDI